MSRKPREAGGDRPAEPYIQGVINANRRLDFGIGAFFVPEGAGHIVEDAGDVKVVVSLGDGGRAVIKSVLVDGLPFNPDRN